MNKKLKTKEKDKKMKKKKNDHQIHEQMAFEIGISLRLSPEKDVKTLG